MSFVNLHRHATITGHVLAVICAFSLVFQPAPMSIASAGFLIAYALSGNYRQKLNLLRTNPLLRATCVLMLWMFASIFWADVPFQIAFGGFWQYRELLLLILLCTLIVEPKWAKAMLIAFIIAYVIALITSYLRWFGFLDIYHAGPYAAFTGHTSYSLLLAIGVCLFTSSTTRIEYSHNLRIAFAVIALLSALNLIFINTGRTGQIAILGLISLYLYYFFGLRGLIYSIALVVLLATALYFSSEIIHKRTLQTISDINSFRLGNYRTNDSMRILFWVNGLKVFLENPIFGVGAGAYGQHVHKIMMLNNDPLSLYVPNPHNEYIMISAQFGLIGLLLFLRMLYVQWRTLQFNHRADTYLGYALLILFCSGNLFNSLLLDQMEAHLFILLTAILLIFSRHQTNYHTLRQ